MLNKKSRKLKNLRKLYEEERKLWEELPYTKKKVSPIFWGTLVVLEAKRSYASRMDGLAEAVKTASPDLEFSSEELRKCNIRIYDYDEDIFGSDGYLIPLNVKPKSLNSRKFDKLSDEAKEWFVPYVVRTWNGETMNYSLKCPESFYKVVYKKLYITSLSVDNAARRSRLKNISMETNNDTDFYPFYSKELGQHQSGYNKVSRTLYHRRARAFDRAKIKQLVDYDETDFLGSECWDIYIDECW